MSLVLILKNAFLKYKLNCFLEQSTPVYVRSQVAKKKKKQATKNRTTYRFVLLSKNKTVCSSLDSKTQQILTISLRNSDLLTNHHKTDKAKNKFKSKRTEIMEENYPNTNCCIPF